MISHHYTYDSLLAGYQALGIEQGDLVFVTTGLGFLGSAKGVQNLEALCDLHLSALNDVVGSTGGIIVPMYSYSFGSVSQSFIPVFNRDTSSPEIGPFPKFVLKKSEFLRSIDPMVSCSISGESWHFLIENLPLTSYGYDSLFERLLSTPAKLVSIGLGSNWTPFIHYLDYIKSADYRYDKLFYGVIDSYNNDLPLHWNYSVACSLPRGTGNCQKLGYLSELAGIWSSIGVGKNSIYSCSYRDYFSFSYDSWDKHTWLTTKNYPQLFIPQPTLWNFNSHEFSPSSVPNDANASSEVYFNPITGLSIKSIFDKLSHSVKSSRIDFISFKTGSNLGKYVVPEDWTPTLLEVSSNNQILFRSIDADVIRTFVLPHSRSIELTASMNDLESYRLKSVQSCFKLFSQHSVIYVASATPLFVLLEKFFVDLKFDKHFTVDIKFTASSTSSSLEALLITPYISQGTSRKLFIIDSLVSHSFDSQMMNEINHILASGHNIILSPGLLAPTIFKYNYPTLISECELINSNTTYNSHNFLSDVTKISFNNTPRPSPPPINTLDFYMT